MRLILLFAALLGGAIPALAAQANSSSNLSDFDVEFERVGDRAVVADKPMTPTELELYRAVQRLLDSPRTPGFDNSGPMPSLSRHSILSLKLGKRGNVLLNFRDDMRPCEMPEDDSSYCFMLENSIQEVLEKRLPRGPFPANDPRSWTMRTIYTVFEGVTERPDEYRTNEWLRANRPNSPELPR